MKLDFLSTERSLHEIARRHVERDDANARLSRAFRMYYRLRPLIPIRFRQLLQRSRKVVAPAGWYLPQAFLDEWAAAINALPTSTHLIHPWPDDKEFAFVLTHDVETRYGVERIAKLAAVEEELGFRSSWNIVPYKYEMDAGLARDLAARGFEIGIHGYNHDGKLYWSRRVFAERAVKINEALRKYNAVGFRSPMVHRNLEWLQMLDVEYDASFFDADPFQAMPGGVGHIWPFLAGKFVELPYTLPQDHTLFIALGQSDTTIWQQKLDYIAKHSGMALMLTHPDYLDTPSRLDAYREFLISVKERGGFWHALPRDVTRWWRDRAGSRIEQAGDSLVIRGPAANAGRIVELHSDGKNLSLVEPAHQVPV